MMKNQYSLGEILKNIISLIYTKLFFKKARLIRRPFYIRGKKFFEYGNGLTTGYSCRMEIFQLDKLNKAKITIGKNCKMGDNVHIAAGNKVEIGENCLIASKVYISDISHGDYKGDNQSNPLEKPDLRKFKCNSIEIGDNVWIGENVCILPGVKIGDGVIIGANSVVNKNVIKNSIVAGVPAKVIKIYNFNNEKWEKLNEGC